MEKLMSYMILIILMVNFLKIFLSLFFKLKIDIGVLSCGIVGYCGNRPTNPNNIKLLMMFNMERGEDGAGWAVNNKVEKDTEKVSKFLSTHTLDVSEEDENYSVIAHARKCSSGTKLNKELVHPFGVYKEGVEKERYDLILAMNGTLSNEELIAETFGIEFKKYINSDTQIMAKAIAKLGDKEYTKVIEGYNGTATLVFFTPKHPNTMMVYKDPERPLFYWQKAKDEMYISSIEEALYSIGALKADVKSFEGEHLYRIVKGKITKNEKIERIPLKPKATYRPNTNNNSHFPKDKNTYEAEYVPYCRASPLSRENIKKLELFHEKDKNKNPHSGKGSLVYVISDRYYRNGHQICGKYWITDTGKVKDEPVDKSVKALENFHAKQYFFVNGYLCSDEHNYNELLKKCSDIKGDFDLSKFKVILLSEVSNYLMYPVITIVDRKEKWILNEKYKNKITKLGDTIVLDMFLSTNVFTLKYNGEWTKLTKKEVCDLVNVSEKEVVTSSKEDIQIEEIIKRVGRGDQIKYLKNVIKNDSRASTRSNYYYSIMRADIFKREPSNNLRLYYYNLLLELLYNEGALNNEELSGLKKEGTENGFSSNDTTLKVDTYLEMFVNKSNGNKGKSSILLESSEFSNADIIHSLKLNNSLYSTEKFRDELMDGEYEEFIDIITSWVNTDHADDLRPLLEAVLLCYGDIGHITEEELINALNNPVPALRGIVGGYYSSYRKQFSEESKNIIDQINSVRSRNEDDQDDEEERVDETYNSKEYEEICKKDYQELIDGLKGYINGIDEVIDDELKSKWVRQSANIVTDMVKFMERRQFVNDLNEQNEHK